LTATRRIDRRSARSAAAATGLWLLVAIAAAGGCSTVDNGDPPADVNACRPSQQYFYDQICPNYLAMDYGGKTCMDANCHGSQSMNGGALKITLTSCTQDAPPTFPFVAGSAWFASYISTTTVMNCTDVSGAALYTNPSGLVAGHGGGKLFEPGGPEFTLLQQWVMPGP
jgi:hypothetical protein